MHNTVSLGLDLLEPKSERFHAILIPKLAMVTSRVHYEALNSKWPQKCEHVVEFPLFFYKRLCTGPFGICQRTFCRTRHRRMTFW